MTELCCENLSVWCIWLYVMIMPRTSFRVSSNLEWITIRTLKLVRHMIITCSINYLCRNTFVCYLKALMFHSSQLKKMLQENKKSINIFLLWSTNKVHRFLFQNTKWGKPKIITKFSHFLKGNPAEHQYLTILAKGWAICLLGIIKICIVVFML